MLKRVCYTAEVVYNGLGTARADGAVIIQQSTDNRNVIAIADAAEAREGFAEAEFQHVGFAILPMPADACVDVRELDAVDVQRRLEQLEPCRVGLVTNNINVAQTLVETTLPDVPPPFGVVYWAADSDDVMQLATTLNDLRKVAAGWRVGLWLEAPNFPPLDARRLTQYLQQTDTPLYLDMRTVADVLSYLKTNPLLAARPALRLALTAADGDEAVAALVTHIRKADSVVVHCPFEDAPLEDTLRFPWEAFMAQGVDVALGSGRGEGVLEHLIQRVRVQQQQHASPLALVRAAVKSGHRALGIVPPRFVRGDDAGHITFWSG